MVTSGNLDTNLAFRKTEMPEVNMLAGSGALISRSIDDLLSAFDDIEIQVKHEIKGNLTFIKYG